MWTRYVKGWVSMTSTAQLQTELEKYARMAYPINVVADEDGGYVVVYPDLPGCITQVETLEEIPAMAREILELWVESELELGHSIPPPSYPEEYSGKFNLRLPRSLHRRLAESAEREGVSLNQYVVSLLEAGDAVARIEERLDGLEAALIRKARRAG